MHGQYCLTTLRRVMQLAKHLSAFCRQRFSQSVTRSLWSKQLSRAFIEQTLVSTNISLGGKLSRLLRFFSRPSFPFFLSQTINENCTCCCCVQSCFIDYRAYTRNWNTFLLYLKSFYYPDYHYTCTHQICLSFFELYRTISPSLSWKYALWFFVFRQKFRIGLVRWMRAKA